MNEQKSCTCTIEKPCCQEHGRQNKELEEKFKDIKNAYEPYKKYEYKYSSSDGPEWFKREYRYNQILVASYDSHLPIEEALDNLHEAYMELSQKFCDYIVKNMKLDYIEL